MYNYNMKNSKSDYKWNFSERILTIEDLNMGRMSVTNNIVNILSEIKQQIGNKIHEAKIIYRDSEMIWDGVEAEWTVGGCAEVRFYHIGEIKITEALKKIRR